MLTNTLLNKMTTRLNRSFERIWTFLCFSLAKIPKLSKERIGSDYGGWTFCPSQMEPDSIVFSVGVGEDITFDLGIMEQYDCAIYAFDPTPRVREWLEKQDLPERFMYFDVGLAHYDGEAKFYPPENPNFVSHTILDRPQTADRMIIVKMSKLSTLMRQIGVERIDLLKMDIEGAEYGVVADMLASGIYPGQVLVEFHHFQPDISIFKTIWATVSLLMHGYRLFNLSASGHEYSFIYDRDTG